MEAGGSGAEVGGSRLEAEGLGLKAEALGGGWGLRVEGCSEKTEFGCPSQKSEGSRL